MFVIALVRSGADATELTWLDVVGAGAVGDGAGAVASVSTGAVTTGLGATGSFAFGGNGCAGASGRPGSSS